MRLPRAPIHISSNCRGRRARSLPRRAASRRSCCWRVPPGTRRSRGREQEQARRRTPWTCPRRRRRGPRPRTAPPRRRPVGARRGTHRRGPLRLGGGASDREWPVLLIAWLAVCWDCDDGTGRGRGVYIRDRPCGYF
jgi:hypothetical protein